MALTKATITNLGNNKKFEVLFNPNEYTIAKTNSWQARPVVGKNVPQLDFTGGGARTLTLELFLDVMDKANETDVRPYVDKLWELTMIDEAHKNAATDRSRPPLCLFQWGGNWHFKAAVTSLSVRYTLFGEDGIPIRAIANVTLEEAEDEADQPGTNPTSYSEAGARRREIRPRDTLALIAYQEYGDSSKWRPIAEANGIDDPRKLTPGQIIAIPTL